MDVSLPLAHSNGSFGSYGISLSTALTLSRNPVVNNEAAPKQYIDNKLISINSVRINSGILNKERLPAFTGDIISNINSGNLQLTQIGQQGIYCKVSVNDTGLISEGFILSEDDIPSLSWNKVTEDLPVDLTGYNINDAINNTGDTAEGFITLNSVPTESDHAITKNYVDVILNTGGGNNSALTEYPIGTIIKVKTNNPGSKNGYLLCNGSYVSKTLYNNLYSIIGDKYSYTNIPSVTPWVNQYTFNEEPNSFLNEAKLITEVVTSLPTNAQWGLPMNYTLIIKNRIYIFTKIPKHTINYPNHGKIFYRQILPNGQVDPNSNWVEETNIYNYPKIIKGTIFMVKNKLYIVGGYVNLSHYYYDYINGEHCQYIWRCIINEDGTLNDFEKIGRFPFVIENYHVVQIFNKLHFIGGLFSNAINTNDRCDIMFTMEIDDNGNIVSQGLTENNLIIPKYTIREMYINSEQRPLCMTSPSIAITKAGIFVIGGYRYLSNLDYFDDKIVFDNKIIKLALNNQGDVINIEPIEVMYPVAYNVLTLSSVIQTKNSVYLILGETSYKHGAGTEVVPLYYLDPVNFMADGVLIYPSNKIYKLDLDSNGDITNWVEIRDIPDSIFYYLNVGYLGLVCTSSKVYIVTNDYYDIFVYSLDFSGGYNDYTLSNTNLLDSSRPNFRLPDLNREVNKFYYIKY